MYTKIDRIVDNGLRFNFAYWAGGTELTANQLALTANGKMLWIIFSGIIE